MGVRLIEDIVIPLPGSQLLARHMPRPLVGPDLGQSGDWITVPAAVEPGEVVEVGPPVLLRHQRVVRLRLFPVQPGEGGAGLWLHRALRIEVVFEGERATAPGAARCV